MYFTETEALRELEILMQMIPGFQPKGYGSMVMPDQIYICLQEPSPPTYQEMIADSLRLLQHLARIIQNRIEDERKGGKGGIDRKLKRKIDEKKQAHGLKQG